MTDWLDPKSKIKLDMMYFVFFSLRIYHVGFIAEASISKADSVYFKLTYHREWNIMINDVEDACIIIDALMCTSLHLARTMITYVRGNHNGVSDQSVNHWIITNQEHK